MDVRRTPAAVVLVMAVVAGGCASSSSSTSASAPTKKLNIVAGENFWGSIASQLAGKAGTVTSVVTDPNADPHTYESSSDNARAFATADYVLVNGAGYDAWAGKLLSANPNGKRKVLTVAALLGKTDGDNPHFWYQPDYLTRVTDQVTADLKSLDPADSSYFDAQRHAVDMAFAPIRSRLAAIKAAFAGTPVAATESIFGYLAGYLGLNVISPPEFMRAISEGNDPPAPSVARFEDQLAKKQAKALVYNLQTSTVLTTNVEKQATQVGIPTVPVTETIQPADAMFEQWFGTELDRLQSALSGK